MSKPKYAVRSIICQCCGITVTKRMAKGRKYCSLNCWRKSDKFHNQQKVERIIVKCNNCGKSLSRTPRQILVAQSKSNNHFCSIICANQSPHYKVKGELVECKICKTMFRAYKNRNRIYCSIICRNNDVEWVERVCYAANDIQNKKKGPNRLELMGNTILDKIGVKYNTQVLINGKISVDVLLTDTKIIIQWDGDYWHGFKPSKKTGEFDERQKARMIRDKSQTTYLEKCGYTVLRFWEHDVINEYKGNHDIITKAIRQITTTSEGTL